MTLDNETLRSVSDIVGDLSVSHSYRAKRVHPRVIPLDRNRTPARSHEEISIATCPQTRLNIAALVSNARDFTSKVVSKLDTQESLVIICAETFETDLTLVIKGIASDILFVIPKSGLTINTAMIIPGRAIQVDGLRAVDSSCFLARRCVAIKTN